MSIEEDLKMSVFVVIMEQESGSEIVGVYQTDKIAKSEASNYITEDELKFKKKQGKTGEIKNLLFIEDTKEPNARKIWMTKVPFDFPKVKNTKAKKDPLAPKKGLSAFMIFSNENRKNIKDDNEGITFGEIGKKIGESWKSLSEAEKIIYLKKSEADKERYQQENSVYTKTEVDVKTKKKVDVVETVVTPIKTKKSKKALEA